MDYLIRNGIVIDPSGDIAADTPLLIRNGIAQAYAGGGLPHQVEVIDATDCYVVPGLMDSHLHVNRDHGGFGENADLLCIPNGVTCAIDAGSLGVNGLTAFLEEEVPRYDTDVRVLAHVVSSGQDVNLPEESADPKAFETEQLMTLFRTHPQRLKGLKIRCNAGNTAGLGLAPLYATIEIAQRLRAEGLWCPITVHLGPLEKGVSLGDLLAILGPGDVVSHVFQSQGETILDEAGHIRRCVWEARERGVLFDFAHGRINFTWRILQRAADEGFYPDLLGSDIHAGNRYLRPAFSIMQTLSMMEETGMPLERMITALTTTAAKAYDVLGCGAILTGAPTNIAILQRRNCELELRDRADDMFLLHRVFCTLLTIRKGQVRYRQGWF